MKSRLMMAVLVTAMVTGCAPRVPKFDEARITEVVRVLSADDFEGRAPATAGEARTVEYLVAKLGAAGLAPGGDLLADGRRAWTQDLPLARAEIEGPVRVQVNAGRSPLQWTQGAEVAIRAAQTGDSELKLSGAPVVFVGYGVTAPERRWDDFKDVDLKGKIALILVNDPDFETGSGDFGGKAMTYYGRWTYKYEEMARRGAAGALVIHEREPAAYGWETVKNSNTGPVFDVQRDDPRAAHVPLEGWIQRDAAAGLLQKAGLEYEALKRLARQRDFHPVELKGVTLDVSFAVKREKVISKNIVAVLPGRSHPDEWVLYTAHWDHLGKGQPDAEGDAIFNGAVDNAAGVAQLLEIARAFEKAPRTERSLGFLNTDSPRPTSPARDFMTSGDAPLTLMDSLIEAGRELKRSHSPDSRAQAGLFFRSDHFSFAKRGVPAISFKSGDDLSEGGVAAGKAWVQAYDKDRYHQPNDEFDAKTWRSDGIAADALLLYALGRRLADSREWPEWKAGSEFKAIRDESAAQRN
jgi:Zn-dependent M28 family amino/carboxypeptidase